MVKFWGKQLAFTRIVFLGLAFFATWCSLLSPQPAEHNQLLFNRSYTIATVLPRTCHALLCSPVHRHMLWKEQLHFIHVSLLHCHANKKKTRSMFTKTTMKNIRHTTKQETAAVAKSSSTQLKGMRESWASPPSFPAWRSGIFRALLRVSFQPAPTQCQDWGRNCIPTTSHQKY